MCGKLKVRKIMTRPCNSLSFQQVQNIEFTNVDGIHMQVFLEPLPKYGSYFSGRATFVIGCDEITGTHYWPNLAVELIEHISQSHPNQIIQKAFSKLQKYDLSTDIVEVKEHIKAKYADEMKEMPKEWHEDFNDAFDDWSGMHATTESLFFTNETEKVLSKLLGDNWQEYDIFPKTKNSEYALVKRMLHEFQIAMRGEMKNM